MLRRATVTAMRLLPYRVRLVVSRTPFASRLAARLIGEPGLSIQHVRSGPLAGAQLELDLSTEKAFLIGSHEPLMRALVEELATPGTTAWDIGAHIGFFSLVLARRCKRVVAVEAHPDNARRLRRNMELNDAPVQIVEMAIAGAPGEVLLVHGPLDGTHRLANVEGARWRDEAPNRTTAVQATTLDALARQYGYPDLIKIDIEGAEIVALEGAAEVLRRKPVIVCETHGARIRTVVEEILHAAGYGHVDRVDDDHLVARR